MMQFAVYTRGEPILDQFIRLTRGIFLLPDLQDRVEQSNHLLIFLSDHHSFFDSSDEYRKRVLLIFARLYFYQYVDEDCLKKVFNLLDLSSPVKDSFFVQELSACIGPKLTLEYEFSLWDREDNLSDFSYVQENPARYLVYRPVHSGFFSILENIVNAQIFCDLLGKKLLVDTGGNWWTAPVSFEGLFGGVFQTFQDLSTVRKSSSDFVIFDFLLLRHLVFHLAFVAPQEFSARKSQIYESIYQLISRFWRSSDYSNDTRNLPLLYLRAGGKLDLEAVPLPLHKLKEDLRLIGRRYNRVNMLSDDWGFIEKLREKTVGDIESVNITKPLFDGYRDTPELKIDNFNAMLDNFSLMAESSILLACPSSNIVNAAAWSRSYEVGPWFQSIPLARYLVL